MATNVWHTCAVIASDQSAASGKVYCWGSTEKSALGSGNFRRSPSYEVQTADNTPLQAVAIAIGHHFSCAINRENQVVCWGGADGRTTAMPVLNINKELTVKQITATDDQICALLTNDDHTIQSTIIECTSPI